MTLLIGCLGSMGQRYQAILNYLKEPFEGIDVAKFSKRPFKEFDRFIIATPTPTHFKWFLELQEFKKPILIEKPISKNLDEVRQIVNGQAPVSMMMQYKFLMDPTSMGPSSYNYFRHGNDGLVWDLFQIIALSNSHPDIAEDSPIWSCWINGKKLNLSDMDAAYVKAVSSFLSGQMVPPHQIIKWHEKVAEFEAQWTLQRFQS